MKIYPGMTIVNPATGSEANVHAVRQGVVFWGGYTAGHECIDIFRTPVEHFSALVEQSIAQDCPIYSLLYGQLEGLGAMVGVRDRVSFMEKNLRELESAETVG